MNLLIADDDPLFRVMLAGITRKWGFEPTVTGDGVEALKLLQQDFPPRLLLIDWEMPRLNGLELCKRVRLMPGNMTRHTLFC
jgi:CheY-like chemotaxis protein